MASEAIDTTLVQTGGELAKATHSFADLGKAAREGSNLVQEQIDKNLKTNRDAIEWEAEMKEMDLNEQLLKEDLESKLETNEAEMGAAFELIDDAIERGIIAGPDYEGFLADREKWWKEQGGKLKFAKDKAKIQKVIKAALKAEGNWDNTVGFVMTATISDSSPGAKANKMAIVGWNKNNQGVPPPIREKNGKHYFVIPKADMNGDGKIDSNDIEGGYNEDEVIMIDIDKVGKAKTSNDVLGAYNEPITFSGRQATIMKGIKGLHGKFEAGQVTQGDINIMRDDFMGSLKGETQLIELADDMINKLGEDVDFAAMGIKDINGDGKITGADLDTDNDGVIDQQEKEKFADLFEAIVVGSYGKEQAFQRTKEGKYTEQQKLTSNIFNYAIANNQPSAINRLPNARGMNTTGDVGTVEIYDPATGEWYDQTFEIEDGTWTEKGRNTLMNALGYINIKAPEVKPEPGDKIEGDKITKDVCNGAGHVWSAATETCQDKQGNQITEVTIPEEEEEVTPTETETEVNVPAIEGAETAEACATAGGQWDEEAQTCTVPKEETETETETEVVDNRGQDGTTGTVEDGSGEQPNYERTRGNVSSHDVKPGSIKNISEIPNAELHQMSVGAIEAATGVPMDVGSREIFKTEKELRVRITETGNKLKTARGEVRFHCQTGGDAGKCSTAKKQVDKARSDYKQRQEKMVKNREAHVTKLEAKVTKHQESFDAYENEYETKGCSTNQTASRCRTLKSKMEREQAKIDEQNKVLDTYFRQAPTE